MGHMQLATSPSRYTIPHHGVFKRGSNKIRVVFDGSAKSSTSCSLNDSLLTGPQLQADITDIVIRFRRHPVVFTTDVVKMYRQILVRPSDRSYQHILWRFTPDAPVDTYELNTITYGLTPSPFQAMRVMRQLAADEGANFPEASAVLNNDMYVDDIVTGAYDLASAIALKNHLKELLSRGCFPLSKWTSNVPEMLTDEEHSENEYINLSETVDNHVNIKVLGLQWSPVTDCFSFSVTVPTMTSSHTKRTILSTIARLYDPLGFLAPVIFCAKLILQETWKSQCDWDDEISNPTRDKWLKLIQELSLLEQVSIYRYLGDTRNEHSFVFGFCDASESGYCAGVYLRTSERCNLIKAKTRLAPIKPMTIPRLELCGAVLLAKLVTSIKPLLQTLQGYQIFLFTDSTVVLAWLSSPPHTLKSFVAHRVVHILELTEPAWWNHIPSLDNPADCGSRGLFPAELLNHSLWWAGPKWTSLPQHQWPIIAPDLKANTHPAYIEETKRLNTVLLSTDTTSEFISWTERFSKYNMLLKSFAYVLRFIRLCKRQAPRPASSEITATELEAALIMCVKIIQRHHFPEAYNQPLQLPTHLKRLGVYQDEHEVLRVGGRLKHSSLPYDQKHPILLPRRAHFSTLLVKHYHHLSLHIGCAALQAIIQRKFWVISLRNLCRKIKRRCLTCIRLSKPSTPPYMGDLPSSRVCESNAFHNTAVDFAGPFLARETLRRKSLMVKVYMCLFICLSTKAIHIELARGLSTEDFIDVLDRFVARRGRPSKFLSDCGTNFVGTANYYQELSDWFDSAQTRDELIRHSAPLGVTWDFNPPRSPHFGGIFEAGIKSAKSLLLKLLGKQSFTVNELSTAFTKVEAMLNSRPLYPTSDDPDDCQPLTPGHFLIGGPLAALPEPDLTDLPPNRLSRWQLIRERTQEFWKRWRDQYLSTLTSRKKWFKHTRNINAGDIVLLKDAMASPCSWPYGKIDEVHPGSDGIVRVVTVKTRTGKFKRSVRNLISLQPLFEE